MELVSPLIQYMKDKGFIRDTCDPVSYSVTSSQVNFTAAGTGLSTSIGLNTPYYLAVKDSINHQNATIYALEVISPTFQSVFANGVNNVSSDDVFSNITLNLVNGEGDLLVQTPLSSLLGIAYGGYARKLYQVALKDIIWSNCYIEITGNPSLISAGEGILLNIYYDKKND